MYDPIAYTYDADHHCEACAEKRFGRCRCGDIGYAYRGGDSSGRHEHVELTDSEGNAVGAVSPFDEWWEPSEGCQTLACGTCHGLIETQHREGCEHNYGEDACDLPEDAIA